MATLRPKRFPGIDSDTAPQVPQSAPTQFANGNHDFTLQCVVELQKSMGEVNATMRSVKDALDGVKSKVDDLVGWKHKIIGGAAVLVIVGGVLGWAIGKASDYVSIRVPSGVPVLVAPVATPAPPTPAPR